MNLIGELFLVGSLGGKINGPMGTEHGCFNILRINQRMPTDAAQGKLGGQCTPSNPKCKTRQTT